MNIEIGQPIIWMGNNCVVESIIPHEDGRTEVGIALNGRVYYDWLSEITIAEEEENARDKANYCEDHCT